jgi:hypothetical protein
VRLARVQHAHLCKLQQTMVTCQLHGMHLHQTSGCHIFMHEQLPASIAWLFQSLPSYSLQPAGARLRGLQINFVPLAHEP